MNFDFVFVVLVYRNTFDLKDFFQSFAIPDSKVIIVNSFYDHESEDVFRTIASENKADFLSVPNKGYGYGNNRGCEYALNHYQFKYLIISNADILIRHLDIRELNPAVVSAPNIKTLKGKSQNPAKPYRIPYSDAFMYHCIIHKHKKLWWIPIIANKFVREIFLLANKFKMTDKIYEPHGSFIIFPHAIIRQEYPLFNEEMFLFCEEDHIALKFRRDNIGVVYNRKVKILHKEDGSVSTVRNVREIINKSFVTYYKHWYKKPI